MPCYSPLKGFEDKENGGIVFKRSKNAGKEMEVSCGQCIGCRIGKSREWAARIVHESQMHQDNCFITLTYDQQNLPTDGSLNKEHFQKFMKRLRYYHEEKKIRYFHCGEYGERLSRPHYHACLFGIDFNDREPHSVTNDIVTWTSDELEKIWGKGFATVGELNYQTAAYTSRYIMKKITGARADEHYERLDENTGEIYKLQPEYVTMSLGRKRGEGIGGTFYEKYKTDFYPSDECPVPGKGVFKKPPGYYDRLLETDDPETYARVKQARNQYRDTHKDDFTTDRLYTRYKVKKAQLAQLPRHKED